MERSFYRQPQPGLIVVQLTQPAKYALPQVVKSQEFVLPLPSRSVPPLGYIYIVAGSPVLRVPSAPTAVALIVIGSAEFGGAGSRVTLGPRLV